MKKADRPSLPVALACLVEEHKHMQALTRLLAVKAGQEQELQHSDYCLLRDVVGYLHDYPDQVHHPTEDLILARLGALRPDLIREFQTLQSQHKKLSEKSSELLSELELAAGRADIISEASIRAGVLAFTRYQNRHMQRENRTLFPVALAEFKPADWQRISRRVKLHEDPLFGANVHSSHRTLFEFLLDAEREFSSSLAANSVGVQEKLIVAATALEKGGREGVKVVGLAAGQLIEETRSVIGGESKPKTLGELVIAPWRYGWNMARTMRDCTGDLLGIAAQTTREAFGAVRRPSQE